MSWWIRYFQHNHNDIIGDLSSVGLEDKISKEHRDFAINISKLHSWEFEPWIQAWLSWFQRTKTLLALQKEDDSYFGLEIARIYHMWVENVCSERFFENDLLLFLGSAMINNRTISMRQLMSGSIPNVHRMMQTIESTKLYLTLSYACLNDSCFSDNTKRIAAYTLGMSLSKYQCLYTDIDAGNDFRDFINNSVIPFLSENPQILLYSQMGMVVQNLYSHNKHFNPEWVHHFTDQMMKHASCIIPSANAQWRKDLCELYASLESTKLYDEPKDVVLRTLHILLPHIPLEHLTDSLNTAFSMDIPLSQYLPVLLSDIVVAEDVTYAE